MKVRQQFPTNVAGRRMPGWLPMWVLGLGAALVATAAILPVPPVLFWGAFGLFGLGFGLAGWWLWVRFALEGRFARHCRKAGGQAFPLGAIAAQRRVAAWLVRLGAYRPEQQNSGAQDVYLVPRLVMENRFRHLGDLVRSPALLVPPLSSLDGDCWLSASWRDRNPLLRSALVETDFGPDWRVLVAFGLLDADPSGIHQMALLRLDAVCRSVFLYGKGMAINEGLANVLPSLAFALNDCLSGGDGTRPALWLAAFLVNPKTGTGLCLRAGGGTTLLVGGERAAPASLRHPAAAPLGRLPTRPTREGQEPFRVCQQGFFLVPGEILVVLPPLAGSAVGPEPDAGAEQLAWQAWRPLPLDRGLWPGQRFRTAMQQAKRDEEEKFEAVEEVEELEEAEVVEEADEIEEAEEIEELEEVMEELEEAEELEEISAVEEIEHAGIGSSVSDNVPELKPSRESAVSSWNAEIAAGSGMNLVENLLPVALRDLDGSEASLALLLGDQNTPEAVVAACASASVTGGQVVIAFRRRA